MKYEKTANGGGTLPDKSPSDKLPSGKPLIFRGAATALITPFSGGEPDINAFVNMVEYQINSGIQALVVCGTTGEAPTLTHDEILALVANAADAARGRVPIIAGVGSNDTAKSAAMAIESSYAGADAVMAVTPYYNKTTESGLIAHFYAIANASPVPVIVYNVPPRTNVSLNMNIYRELAKHDNIVAVKEASGDVALASSLLAECADDLAAYSGCDELTLPILTLGGLGVISVVSNILPEKTQSLCRAFFDGRLDDAREIQFYLGPLIKALFSRPNPIPVKAAAALLGMCSPELRLPLYPLDDTAELEGILKKYVSGGSL